MLSGRLCRAACRCSTRPSSSSSSSLIISRLRLLSTSLSASSTQQQRSSSTNAAAEQLGKLQLPRLVYESDINSLVKRVKYFSFSTSVAAMIIQPLMLYKNWTTLAEPLTFMSVGLTSFVCLGMFVTPWLLHWIIKRHVHSIYFDPQTKEFTAITYSLLMRRVLHRFGPSDIIEMTQSSQGRLAEKGISALQFGTICVNGTTPLLLDLSRDAFLDPQAFQIIEDQCPETKAAAEMRARRLKNKQNNDDDDDCCGEDVPTQAEAATAKTPAGNMLRSRAQVYNVAERSAQVADNDDSSGGGGGTNQMPAGGKSKRGKYVRLPSSENDYDARQFVDRSPKSRIPWRAIALASVLLVFGVVLITVGLMLLTGYISQKYQDRTYPVLILGLLMFIPGSYHVFIACHAYMGDPGYSYDDIPDFD